MWVLFVQFNDEGCGHADGKKAASDRPEKTASEEDEEIGMPA